MHWLLYRSNKPPSFLPLSSHNLKEKHNCFMQEPTSWYSWTWIWFSFTRAEYLESVNCVCGVNWWNLQLNCVRLKHINNNNSYSEEKKTTQWINFIISITIYKIWSIFLFVEFRRHIGQTPGHFFYSLMYTIAWEAHHFLIYRTYLRSFFAAFFI